MQFEITKKTISMALITLLIISAQTVSHGAVIKVGGTNAKHNMPTLVKDIKKTVVFIGTPDNINLPHFYGTGVLVRVEGIIHLVTAKHLIVDLKTGKHKDDNMFIFFNSKEGNIVNARSIAWLKEKYNVKWIFHEKPEVDIAIIPFPVDPVKDDVKVVPDNLLVTSDRLFELYDIFFSSYQPNADPGKRVSPIFRGGIISVINEDKTFYIDAAAFPGNSGSPVFLKPSPMRFDSGSITIGKDDLGGALIGVVGEYIPYQDVAISAQTGRPRVIFEENTGLSKVWSVEFIKEILASKKFVKQLNTVKKLI